MKYILVVPDGAADWPVPELGDRTPLEAAITPTFDRMAKEGRVGTAAVIPEELEPGSDVGNMALMGYDPREFYTGRGPLEAVSMGIPLGPRDAAFRCNLVATDGEKMLDHSGGAISSEHAQLLFELVEEKLGGHGIRFFPGVSYRGIMAWQEGPLEVRCQPPHNILDESIEEQLPIGDGESRLRQLIWDSLDLLDNHPLNRRARDEGRLPANAIWPWGQGRTPRLPSYAATRGVTGCVISAVDLIRGLGICAGLRVIHVPGATGYLDTNFRGKAEAAVDALESLDFAMIHVEAPDECGHRGNYEGKVEAIERIDNEVMAPLLAGVAKLDDFRVLVMPDHPTPIALRTHSRDPVPFLLWASDGSARSGKPARFTENSAREDGIEHLDEGFQTIDLLFRSVDRTRL
ncbi:MAG TPA: cofactor-independent phosphoglycerate mutase [Armatimonadota bacterium]|nr:cofactor-independent phosphoglycerate mutase [Armatimonadota bacterium]